MLKPTNFVAYAAASQVLHTCFAQRYPTNMSTRVQDAVWRGSTTDPIVEEFNPSMFMKVSACGVSSQSSTCLFTAGDKQLTNAPTLFTALCLSWIDHLPPFVFDRGDLNCVWCRLLAYVCTTCP